MDWIHITLKKYELESTNGLGMQSYVLVYILHNHVFLFSFLNSL